MDLGWLRKRKKQKEVQLSAGEAAAAASEEAVNRVSVEVAELEDLRIEVPETEACANISCTAEAEPNRSSFVVSTASAPAVNDDAENDTENADLTSDFGCDDEVAPIFYTRERAAAPDGAASDEPSDEAEAVATSAAVGADDEANSVAALSDDAVPAAQHEGAALRRGSQGSQDSRTTVEANRPAVIDDEALKNLVGQQQAVAYTGKTLADRTSLLQKFVCVALAFSLCLMTWNEVSIAEAREMILGPNANVPAPSASQDDEQGDNQNDADADADTDDTTPKNGENPDETNDPAATDDPDGADPGDEADTEDPEADDPAEDEPTDPRADALAAYLPENLVEADEVLPKISDELAKDAPEAEAKLKNLANTSEDDLADALADALQLNLRTSGALLASDGSFHVAATDANGKLVA